MICSGFLYLRQDPVSQADILLPAHSGVRHLSGVFRDLIGVSWPVELQRHRASAWAMVDLHFFNFIPQYLQLGCFLVGNIAFLIAWLIGLYTWVLVARIIIEMIQSFSRSFTPPKWFYMIAEPIFMITDPPVKLLRKVIPPLPLGNVRLDLSVLVLFFILTILQSLVRFLPF